MGSQFPQYSNCLRPHTRPQAAPGGLTKLEMAAQVRDSHQFAGALGGDWRQVAEKLQRLPSK